MKRRLRFCLLTTFYPPYAFGGDGILVQQLAHLLADEGHHVEVIHCQDSFELLRPAQCGNLAYRSHPKVLVHTLGSALGPLSPLLTHTSGHPVANRSHIEKILAQGFDVIHYHNISLIGGPGLMQLGEGFKVYTSHEYWLHCPTHLLLKWGREPCRSKQCALCCLSQSRPPQMWRYGSLMERCCREIDLFLYPAEFGREKHLEAGLPGPVDVLPNFVPDRGLSSTREREGFLYVGRLEEEKGVENLIPVFERLPECRLTIAGKGSLGPKLTEASANLPNVELAGYIEPDKLPELIAGSKAVLLPSRSYELLPLVLLEAFCQSTPVVVSPLGELPRIAHESGTGLVAQTTDEWVEALRTLDRSPEQIESMSKKARAYYLSHNSPSVHLKRYFSLLEPGLTRSYSKEVLSP